MDPGSITLALGPTNTGKTHGAIEQMLTHESGMLGLPLRLLAREVYDRVSARVGEQAVALVTGEERRVPAAPRYWVCTVEAMPELAVDFLAVDEIQLAAHPERGHTFTDRLLHRRGRLETWFLGASTMAPLLHELLPGAELRRQARFSTLRYRGASGLGGLPPRSAAVAFRTDEVYELAGRLRGKRGGAAVVLGALSPRTRNAQVALYEAGEVEHLVATDAIGMGLNLDLEHVAFAAHRKFDGAEHRALEASELAQIAGRAGRHRRDGTFGTLEPARALPDAVVRAIETHQFEPVRRLLWRSGEIDFGSLDALIASLAAPPPDERFVRVERADDYDALRAMAGRDAVRERATTEAERRLLWDVCQVPDYRKLLLVHHVGLLAQLFEQLVDGGRLSPDWVEREVRRIDRVDGPVDQLTARIAAVRVWTYVSHRPDWLADPSAWRERTRVIEDRLSDALHERLVERFVERRRRSKGKTRGARLDVGGPFAALREMLEVETEADGLDALVDAPHEALSVDDVGARLEPGLALEVDQAGAGLRRQLDRRLTAFVKDWLAELLAPLEDADAAAATRGLLYQLRRGLGCVARREAHEQLEALSKAERRALGARGVVLGRRTVYSAPMLEPELLRRRAALLLVAGAQVPAVEGRSAARVRGVSAQTYLSVGYLLLGPAVIRVDHVERGLAAFAEGERAAADALGVAVTELPPVALALGYQAREGRWVRQKKRRARAR